MGRFRDPFERTLTALRERLATRGPLQGAPLPVSLLAQELGVSPTPVREALARLSGEGLVARTNAGYVGVVHDRASLADLYGLAGVLAEAAIREQQPGRAAAAITRFQGLAVATGNRSLAGALALVAAQLAPFGAADALVCGAGDLSPSVEPGLAADAATVRRHFRLRAKKAGEILARALGL